ncbi:MAG: serine/threonine-protein phosphatase, partial [Bacteroidales bacterium]|nr:serine/threonine-protein phosphatase [Bacteroidales bacterium]
SIIIDEVMNASVFQSKFQPEVEAILPMFSDKFLLYMPKDIVSGDFVWKFSDDDYELVAVADCTGHGVPGAMLTMLGMSSLHEIALSGTRNSAEILEMLRSKIIGYMSMNALNKMEDGMDISLIVINKKTLELNFAGAYNNLLYIRDGELCKLKATRCPIGDYIVSLKFESQYLQLKKGDCIFMLSDGFISQFGGPEGRKFPQQQLFDILKENHDKPMEELKLILTENFRNWQGERFQVDDVSILGFRVG